VAEPPENSRQLRSFSTAQCTCPLLVIISTAAYSGSYNHTALLDEAQSFPSLPTGAEWITLLPWTQTLCGLPPSGRGATGSSCW
jgi:hypothetical protein